MFKDGMRCLLVLLVLLLIGRATCDELVQSDNPHDEMIQVQFDVPGNLLTLDGATTVRISCASPVSSGSIVIRPRIFDADLQLLTRLPQITLSAENAYQTRVELPREPGYYLLELQGVIGQKKITTHINYGVIRANPVMDQQEPQSPFGVCTHFSHGWPADLAAIVKRSGIAWMRDATYQQQSLLDVALPIAIKHKLCYLPVFAGSTLMRPDPKQLTADGQWDSSRIAQWYASYAHAYGKDVDVYDLVNEPWFGWIKAFGGDWYGSKWLDHYIEAGRAVTQTIQQADPGARVLWEEPDMLTWYRQYEGHDVDKLVGGISPHPYNVHKNAAFPEDLPLVRQMPSYQAYIGHRQLDWPVWVGEVGISTFKEPADHAHWATARTEKQQADMLVRTMALLLGNGVERVFWYDLMDDGENEHNPEHRFGLIRQNHQPKPAMIAYAVLINQLRDKHWLGAYTLGGNAYAYAFGNVDQDAISLIAWLKNCSKQELIPQVSSPSSVTITDLYGKHHSLESTQGRLSIRLSESPVYIHGLSKADWKAFGQ